MKVASAGQTATLRNAGSLDLGITGIGVTGTCSITTTFTPTALGARAGSLTVSTNSVSSPSTVALSRTGVNVALSPQSLTFGTQLLGSSSAARTVTLTDSGRRTAHRARRQPRGGTPRRLHVHQPMFPDAPYTLAVGSSCMIDVRFNPKLLSLRTRTATLVIDHDAGGAPRSVTLSGTAI